MFGETGVVFKLPMLSNQAFPMKWRPGISYENRASELRCTVSLKHTSYFKDLVPKI